MRKLCQEIRANYNKNTGNWVKIFNKILLKETGTEKQQKE